MLNGDPAWILPDPFKWKNFLQSGSSKSKVLALALSASLWGLLKAQVLRLHPRHAESETLRTGAAVWLNEPSPWLRCILRKGENPFSRNIDSYFANSQQVQWYWQSVTEAAQTHRLLWIPEWYGASRRGREMSLHLLQGAIREGSVLCVPGTLPPAFPHVCICMHFAFIPKLSLLKGSKMMSKKPPMGSR